MGRPQGSMPNKNARRFKALPGESFTLRQKFDIPGGKASLERVSEIGLGIPAYQIRNYCMLPLKPRERYSAKID
jgi:hypothetical protein